MLGLQLLQLGTQRIESRVAFQLGDGLDDGRAACDCQWYDEEG